MKALQLSIARAKRAGTGGGTNPLPPAYKLWSDPASWGGTVPVAGTNVTFADGDYFMYDLATSPSLGYINVPAGAKLIGDPTKTQTLTCKGLYGDGTVWFGTEEAPRPFAFPITIILTGSRTDSVRTTRAAGGFQSAYAPARGISRDGAGDFQFVGQLPGNVRKTRLNDHLAAAATAVTTAVATGWKNSARVVFTPTGFFSQTAPEVGVISGNAIGTAFNISTGLTTHRFGKLQYVNKTGTLAGTMGYTDTGYRHASGNTPYIADARSTLGNLDSAITITCPLDADWTAGHGAHVMSMGLDGKFKFKGAKVLRGGQQDTQARYPIHFHTGSYNTTTGAFIADFNPANHFVVDCVVEQSVNRGIVLHGVCGVLVRGNVLYGHRGQGIFTETGCERRNIIDDNLTMGGTRTSGTPLKGFETQSSAGIWLTNPDNIVTNNINAWSAGNGSWFSFSDHIFDDHSAVVMAPRFLNVGTINNNVGHSCEEQGHRLEFPVVDNSGNLTSDSYEGSGHFDSFTLWKNGTYSSNHSPQGGGYQNRIALADYRQIVQFDNIGDDFFGAHRSGQGGKIANSLIIRETLNTFSGSQPAGPKASITSYHFALVPVDCTVVGYQLQYPAVYTDREVFGSGLIESWDQYLYGVNWLMQDISGIELLSSHPGEIIPPPRFDPIGNTKSNQSVADYQSARFSPPGSGAPDKWARVSGGSPFTDANDGNRYEYGWSAAPADATRLTRVAYGVRALEPVGNMWLQATKYNNTDSDVTLAMSLTNYGGQGPQRTQCEYRAVVKTDGRVFAGVSAGADAALPTPYAFSTFSSSNRVRLNRFSTSVFIETSTDGGGSWTTRYTFPVTTGANLYRYMGVAYTASATNDRIRWPRVSGATYRSWNLTQVYPQPCHIWDPSTYIILDQPYFTYGISSHAVAVGGLPYHKATDKQWLSSDEVFCEADDTFGHDGGDFPYALSQAYNFERLNPADDTVQGTWNNFDRFEQTWTPGRIAALVEGGTYNLRFPDNPPASRVPYSTLRPYWVYINFQAAGKTNSGGQLIWVEWPAAAGSARVWSDRGNFTPDGTADAGRISAGFASAFTSVANKAALVAATTASYLYDPANNRVGIKLPVNFAATTPFNNGGFNISITK